MDFLINRYIYFVLVVINAFGGQPTEGLRILALFPLHGKSHFVMCEKLSKGLAERGHQIDVYSHFPQKKQITNYTDFTLEVSAGADLLPLTNALTYDYFKKTRSTDIKAMVDFGSTICELMNTPVFQKLFNKLKTSQPYDVVIVETFVSHCFYAWGRYLNVPMIGVMTSSLIDWYNQPLGNPINIAVIPSVWSGLFHPMNFWERLKNTLFYHYVVSQASYYIRRQNKYVEQFFGEGYPHAYDLVKEFDLFLVNSHYSIDGIRAFTPAIVPVGGLHLVDDGTELPKDVQTWLDESKDGCIYFSFGSMVRIETFPKPILDAFYAAFEAIAPVRVLIKIAKPEELPKRLPPNVMSQTWYPQIQVLKHKNVKAFVTHGGLMSAQEALYASVPMIGVPLFGDQYANVKILVRRMFGVMLDLDNISEKTATHAFKEILNNSIYTENAKRLSKEFFDRPMSPMDSAIFWVEYVARRGKNCLRSPVLDLPWWQLQLIDVYGFILLVVVIVCYVLKTIVMNLLCCCRQSSPNDEKVKKE